jgi:hypothetical protein
MRRIGMPFRDLLDQCYAWSPVQLSCKDLEMWLSKYVRNGIEMISSSGGNGDQEYVSIFCMDLKTLALYTCFRAFVLLSRSAK